MTSSFFRTIEAQPATFAHIIAMTLLYMYQWNYNVPYDKIGVQYDKVVLDDEYWRVILSAYSHGSILHIAFNMYSLWNYGYVEQILGTLTYLRFSFLLLISSELLMLVGTWILFTYFRRENERRTYTVGYSGVVFGWMAVAALLVGESYNIFGLNLPAWLMPFIFLILTQLLIPNASFIGHLSGILVGFVVGAGWCDWFDNYLFLSAFIWTLVAIIVSVKLTTDVPMGCIQILDPDVDEISQIRMVNGVIVYRDDASPEQNDESL